MEATITRVGNTSYANRVDAIRPKAAEMDRAPTILARTASFLKTSATHYLESISPRGKDRFYAWGGLAGVAVTALVYALPDGPQHLWVIPLTAGLWKGIATSVATGVLSYSKYRGYLSEVQSRASQVGQAEIGQAEGITAENRSARIEQMGLAARQLAREKNRLKSMTPDQFQQRIHDIASEFVLGEAAAVEEVKEALAKSLMDREEKYALFKSRMASFTGGMAATTLLMNLTNFAFYQLSGEGLGHRLHEGLSAEPKAPLPAADQATPPPSPTVPPPPEATAVPPPVETQQPAPAPVTPVVTSEPQQDIMEGAAKRAIETWQQTEATGNLPHVDKETLARAAEVGSHFAEIDSSANIGIQEALTILKQNGFDNPSESAIREIQEKILHLAEDLANSSDLPVASDYPAAYKETYTNLLNAHLDQFQTIARQALIESQPAALEKLTAVHSYSGNFDTLALWQAFQDQGLNLDVTRLSGDTARILGTIYQGLDTVSGSHLNYIDPADWSNRLATTLRVGDRSEIEAFVKWVGVPQVEMADILARLFAGDRVVFDQIIQALGAFTPEKRAVVERIIEAASRNDPDAIKILQAIGHWKRSNVLNIPANIKLLLEYKYGLNR